MISVTIYHMKPITSRHRCPSWNLRETEIAGLLERCVFVPDAIERADVVFDIAGLVPITNLDLVFVGVDVFLAAGDRLVLQKLEAIVDAVVRRQRGRECHAGLEHPRFALL